MYVSSMKIVFLVIASEDVIHQNDLLAQKNTWASSQDEDSRVIWLRGHNESRFKLEGNTLYVPCKENYQNILEKTILGIRYIEMTFDYDVLVRTNVSTYFHIEKLRRKLSSPLYKQDFFGGFTERTKQSYFDDSMDRKFVSGTGVFLSKAAVSRLIELDPTDFVGVPDDVSISHFLMRTNLYWIPMTRNNLSSTHFFFPSYFTRTKSSSDPSLASKRMLLIHDFYCAKSLIAKANLYLRIIRIEFRAFLHQPEPITKYFLKNRLIVSSFLLAKGFRLWRRLKLL